MSTRVLVFGAVLVAACASRTGGAAPAPATPIAPPTSPPPADAPLPRRSDAIRYGPSALRYLVHRRVHIEQALGGQTQVQDLGVRIYVAATMSGPADSVGYPATFTVDSIVADSGAPLPPPVAESANRARKLVFSGRLRPRGEFVNGAASDSVLAQSLIQLLGNFRDFLPRIPRDGVQPGAVWTDTLESTQRGASSEVTRRAILHSAASTWEDRAGTRSLRLEGSSTYQIAGAGQNAGQPFELAGSGSATVMSFIAIDGRYLGGESRDSTTLTVRLPVQGAAIPVMQVTRTTVAVLP